MIILHYYTYILHIKHQIYLKFDIIIVFTAKLQLRYSYLWFRSSGWVLTQKQSIRKRNNFGRSTSFWWVFAQQYNTSDIEDAYNSFTTHPNVTLDLEVNNIFQHCKRHDRKSCSHTTLEEITRKKYIEYWRIEESG